MAAEQPQQALAPTKDEDDPSQRTSDDVEKKGQEKSSDEHEEKRQITGFRWFLVCVSLYLSALIYGLDTTIVADVQAAVISTFGEVEKLTWLGAGFSLGSIATVLPIGGLYFKFNQKWVYIISLVLFEGGSALCGGAPDMDSMIVGRVIAGIGGSGIYLGALNYMSMTTTPKERGGYIAGIGAVWGVGCILGPVVGGAFSVSSATWRWAFYINLVIAAIFAPVYLFYLPSLRAVQGVPFLTRLANVDWVGFVLSAGVWACFTVGFIFAGSIWPWNDGRTIAILVVFGVLLIAFAIQQKYTIFTTPENRSFPVHLLGSRTQVLLYFGTSASITGLFVPVYYIPLYFQFVQSDSAITAAVRLLPFVLVAMVTNLATGALLPKVGRYMPIYLISGVFMTIGGATLYTVDSSTPVSHVYGFSILGAVGAGMTLQTGYSVATLKVTDVMDKIAAVSMQNVAQIGGTVFALVLSGQVFQSYAFRNLTAVLAAQNFSAADIRAAVAGESSRVFETISEDVRVQAVDAITEAMQRVYILVVAAGSVLIISALAMRREKIVGS